MPNNSSNTSLFLAFSNSSKFSGKCILWIDSFIPNNLYSSKMYFGNVSGNELLTNVIAFSIIPLNTF